MKHPEAKKTVKEKETEAPRIELKNEQSKVLNKKETYESKLESVEETNSNQTKESENESDKDDAKSIKQ